jgi:NAD(P)-dependent dehydrogenase (short-subunit alcohol dehydrogenase family)
MSKVFFITGAGRGMGADFARAALAAGHRVVAGGRDPEKVEAALGGPHPALLAVRLDVTSPAQAQAAASAAVAAFGRIDVLVNNAGVSYKGFFEELSDQQLRAQLEVNLIGPMNVTRAVLPVMRGRRAGHVLSISSGAGLVGFEYSSVYAASKFALEGWMEALHLELAPLGIATTIVEPGFFRTELLATPAEFWAEPSIADYAERNAVQRPRWAAMDGTQPGDPAKLAAALLQITDLRQPPLRFMAGRDVLDLAEAKINGLRAQAAALRDLSVSLAYDDADSPAGPADRPDTLPPPTAAGPLRPVAPGDP